MTADFLFPNDPIVHSRIHENSSDYNIRHTVWCLYNALNCLKTHHKRIPLVRPLWRDMSCLLWVQAFIYMLPRSPQWCRQHNAILDRVKTTLAYIFFKIPLSINDWCTVFVLITYLNTETVVFWWPFRHCLHFNLLNWQLSAQSVTKNSSKWQNSSFVKISFEHNIETLEYYLHLPSSRNDVGKRVGKCWSQSRRMSL